MNKTTQIILAVVAVAVVAIVGVILMMNSKPGSKLNVSSVEDLTALVDQIYEGVSIEMPMLMTQELDVTDTETLESVTGIQDTEYVEYAVTSEPMMTSQAYSLILVKLKDEADPDAIANTMKDRVDERKWICVTAEKIYSTSSGNVVCLVMSNEETAKAVYDSFKKIAGSVGQEFERTSEEPEMPEDMLPGADMLPAEDGNMEDESIDQPAAM